jgi:hypothetical protein
MSMMIRNRLFYNALSLILIAVLLTVVQQPVLARAQTPFPGVDIEKNEVIMNLPKGLVFHLHASASSKIKDAMLLYGVDSMSCQEQTTRQIVKFTADQQIEVQWEWKFDQSGTLPPGTNLWWQWEVTTETGEKLHTQVMTTTVIDQRHDWKTISRNGIYVVWYQGEQEFGREMLEIAVTGLNRLEREMGVRPDGEVWITIYPSSTEVVEVVAHVPEWAGGVAFPEYSSMIIGVDPRSRGYAYEVIPHEMTHLIVGKLTFNCQGINLPTWLNEGLAVYAEGPISAGYRTSVMNALEKGSLPELVTLRAGFSAYGDSASLSYAQSGVVVEYLAREYSSATLADLLAAFQQGLKEDAALTEIYGFGTAQLDRVRRSSLGYSLPTLTPTSESGSTRPTRTPVPTLPLFTSIVQVPAGPSETPSQFESTNTPTPFSTATPAAVAVVNTEPPGETNFTPPSERPLSGSGRTLLLAAGLGVVGIVVLVLIAVAYITIRKRS